MLPLALLQSIHQASSHFFVELCSMRREVVYILVVYTYVISTCLRGGGGGGGEGWHRASTMLGTHMTACVVLDKCVQLDLTVFICSCC